MGTIIGILFLVGLFVVGAAAIKSGAESANDGSGCGCIFGVLMILFGLLNNIDKDPADVVKKVKKVARKEGFNVVKYEGEFDGARVYSPVFKEDLKIGMPQFVLAKLGVAYLVIGEYGLRIIDALNNSKENGVR